MRIEQGLSGFLIIVVASLQGCTPENATVKIPYETPPIATSTIQEIHEMIDAARGSVVVVNLWATWCPPCVVETPALSRYFEEFADGEVAFLSVSADELIEADKNVRLFVNSYEIPFPVHVVGPQEQEDINSVLGIDWDGLYPGTFLIGQDGVLVRMWAGEVSYDQLRDATQALLAG